MRIIVILLFFIGLAAPCYSMESKSIGKGIHRLFEKHIITKQQKQPTKEEILDIIDLLHQEPLSYKIRRKLKYILTAIAEASCEFSQTISGQ